MSQSLLTLRYDMTWNAYIVWIWLIVECDLAIICISVPILRPLFKKWLPKKEPQKSMISKPRTVTGVNSPATPQLRVQNGRIVRTDGVEMYSQPAENGNQANAMATAGTGAANRPGGLGVGLSPRPDDPLDRRNNPRWGKRDPYDLDDLDRPYSRRDPLSRV
jgi:hypothetical protein